MSRKTIITGTIILTTANLITRCMGFFNRVYLSNAIGAEGIGLYQLILPVYGLAWSITSAGFTTAISHLTAQEHAKGQRQRDKHIAGCGSAAGIQDRAEQIKWKDDFYHDARDGRRIEVEYADYILFTKASSVTRV